MVSFDENKSFTNEQMAELHIHGSIIVIKTVMETLSKLPFLRQAFPGEFTQRALENNKLNLTQVEGLSDLLKAETEYQQKQALDNYTGKTSFDQMSRDEEFVTLNINLFEFKKEKKSLLDEISKMYSSVPYQSYDFSDVSDRKYEKVRRENKIKKQKPGSDIVFKDIKVKGPDGNTEFFYIPGCASMPDWLKDRIDNSNLILFDGTLWTDDEMIKENVGIKTGQRMGHMSMSGPEGSIEAFKKLSIKRNIRINGIGFISLGSTNDRFATLMREIAENNNGTFLAMPIVGMDLRQ
mgnify:CR=1 FL=1